MVAFHCALFLAFASLALASVAAVQSTLPAPPYPPIHRIAFLPDLSAANCSAGPTEAEVTLTPASLWRSTLSYGDEVLFAPVATRFRDGQPLRVLTLGGSVTCGVNELRPGSPGLAAWPALLEAQLNERFPLPGGTRHSVTNGCKPGVGSDFWVQCIASWRTNDPLSTQLAPNPFANGTVFDLVIVETAVNDVAPLDLRPVKRVGDSHLDLDDHVRKYTELLLLQLLHTEPRLALLWLTASSRGAVWTGGERRTDAAWLHLPILRHHGIHMVSSVDATGPYLTDKQKNFSSVDLRIDWVHLTPLGHALNAGLVLQAIASQSLSAVAMLPGEAAAAYKPRPPLHASAADVEIYLHARPFSISLLFDGAKKIREADALGWTAYEDVPNKRGFIANTTGASAVWVLDPKTVAKHVLNGRMDITSLRSYEVRRAGLLPRRQFLAYLFFRLAHLVRSIWGRCSWSCTQDGWRGRCAPWQVRAAGLP